MSLIAIGWDGYIRASGVANIMREKKNQLTMAVGKAQKFSTFLVMRRLLMIKKFWILLRGFC